MYNLRELQVKGDPPPPLFHRSKWTNCSREECYCTSSMALKDNDVSNTTFLVFNFMLLLLCFSKMSVLLFSTFPIKSLFTLSLASLMRFTGSEVLEGFFGSGVGGHAAISYQLLNHDCSLCLFMIICKSSDTRGSVCTGHSKFLAVLNF